MTKATLENPPNVQANRTASGFRNMCTQPPKVNRERSNPSAHDGMTTDDLRRAVERCRDLDDSTLTAQAWDKPSPPAKPPGARIFGQAPNIRVPEDFDEPLPDAEIDAWEADSAD